jgi:SAM-dependent methyltransferase
MELAVKFKEIYDANLWRSKESVSGWGSELKSTEKLRSELPFVFLKYGIGSVLDIPCGDFNWMKEVDLSYVDYIGADIVPDLVNMNKNKFPRMDFRVLDLTADKLPQVDLIFVRDCLGHLSNENLSKAVKNMIDSKSKYLLVTSFTKHSANRDIPDGSWRPINLMVAPYYLKPIYLINENCKEGYPHYNDKSMILIDLSDPYSL